MAKKQEDLASVLADTLNKKNKDGKVAYFLTGDNSTDDSPTNVTDWVSTGNAMLDVAIANRPYAGLPVGRIIEFTGLEQTGKSLICAHALAETQKKGGVAVLIDTEMAVNYEFYDAIGLDTSKLLYVSVDTVEAIFETIETIIEKVRVADKDRLVTIVVDSIAAASTKTEMEADYDKDGYATAKAIIMSKALRKITTMIGEQKICLIMTNQLRQKLNAPAFSDPWTTPGGKALGFHASVRVRLTKVGNITVGKDKDKRVVGIHVKAQTIKNRMGPPLRTTEMSVYFDRGIDNYGSWLDVLKDNDIVKQAGAWYTYIDTDSGEELKFQGKDFVNLINENEELKDQLYRKICEVCILKYKNTDEVEVTTDGDDAD
jgi:recombination protein RecA